MDKKLGTGLALSLINYNEFMCLSNPLRPFWHHLSTQLLMHIEHQKYIYTRVLRTSKNTGVQFNRHLKFKALVKAWVKDKVKDAFTKALDREMVKAWVKAWVKAVQNVY